MAFWPPLRQKINYLLASQSIVWYLLRAILLIINGISTDTDTDTGIGPSLIITYAELYQLVKEYPETDKVYRPLHCVINSTCHGYVISQLHHLHVANTNCNM